MKKKRGPIPKIKPPTIARSTTDLSLPPFHIQFPIKISYNDSGEDKVCYFSCIEHLQTHIIRYKLKKNQVKIEKNTGNSNGIN